VSRYLTRRLLRWTWLIAIWAYPRGLISLRTFCAIEDAYYLRCVRSLEGKS
jgi:hypothetical protein